MHVRLALYNQLKCCDKPEVRHLFWYQKLDNRSIFGRNCRNLCRELNVSNMEDINTESIKMPHIVLETETWRLPFLKELLTIRNHSFDTDLSQKEIAEIIDFVCCS